MSSQRITTSRGYNLPASQHSGDFNPSKSEYVITPSTNTPNWGSMFYIDFKEQNLILQENILQLNVGVLTCTSGNSFIPAQLWIDHVDYVVNGAIVNTIYPVEQFVGTQLFQSDEERKSDNFAQGAYDSVAHRTALAATTSNYFIRLRDMFSQAKQIAQLADFQNLQLRVFLQPLANIVNGTSPSATINSCNLISRVIRLRDAEAVSLKNALVFSKYVHYRYNDVKIMSVPVNSGVSTASVILTSFTGPCAYLFFVVRSASGLTGVNTNVFTAISSFEILNNSGSNIVGGQAINSAQSLLIQGKNNTASSYLTETAYGTTNNGANVYLYSFSNDCIQAGANGISSGYRMLTGSEQLKVNFTSALGAAAQIDIFCYIENVYEVSQSGVKTRIFVN